MYIKKVTINNYRSFRTFEAKLQQLTVVIGENDTGKTNFFTALSLPLSGNQIDFNQKRISVSDINKGAVIDFLTSVVNGDGEENQLKKIPKVSVTLEFTDPKDAYETALLAKWIVADGDGVIVIPKVLASEISRDGLNQERYERFAKLRVSQGRPVPGIYPPNDDAKAEYAEWLASRESER